MSIQSNQTSLSFSQWIDLINSNANKLVGTNSVLLESVDSIILKSNTIETRHLHPSFSLGSNNFAAQSITANLLDGRSINGDHIKNSVIDSAVLGKSILNRHIADNSISSALIQNNSIGTSAFANGSILPIAIPDASITGGKLAVNIITSNRIASSTLTDSHFAVGAVTAQKLNFALASSKFASNIIVTSKLHRPANSEKNTDSAPCVFPFAHGKLVLRKMVAGKSITGASPAATYSDCVLIRECEMRYGDPNSRHRENGVTLLDHLRKTTGGVDYHLAPLVYVNTTATAPTVQPPISTAVGVILRFYFNQHTIGSDSPKYCVYATAQCNNPFYHVPIVVNGDRVISDSKYAWRERVTGWDGAGSAYLNPLVDFSRSEKRTKNVFVKENREYFDMFIGIPRNLLGHSTETANTTNIWGNVYSWEAATSDVIAEFASDIHVSFIVVPYK